MIRECAGSRFIILSLPRCGSTSLANLLNCHDDIRCLIEPFHPKRYGGRFFELAARRSPGATLNLIWTQWNGVKHVWESNGWPFMESPHFNDEILLGQDLKVILVIRRNLLRRIVSNHISRQTNFWIGTRSEFCARLQSSQLSPLNSVTVRRQIKMDQDAVTRCSRLLADHGVQFMTLSYEDFFYESASNAKGFLLTNSLVSFLGFSPIDFRTFEERWLQHFDPTINRFASSEVYRRIPEIDKIESEVGCAETGWLFR